MIDNVLHPQHYGGEIETIDYIRDKLPADGFRAYCIGNVLKYISRYDKKGAPLEDLQKAQVYLGWAWLSEDFAVFQELNERLVERFRRKRDGR